VSKAENWNFICCYRCGAVIAVTVNGEGVNNEQQHEDWHRSLGS
jgi:hypothetical protein